MSRFLVLDQREQEIELIEFKCSWNTFPPRNQDKTRKPLEQEHPHDQGKQRDLMQGDGQVDVPTRGMGEINIINGVCFEQTIQSTTSVNVS